MNFVRFLPLVSFLLTVSFTSAHAAFKTAEIFEAGSEKSKLLFKVKREDTIKDGKTFVKVTTSTPDGKEAVVEEAVVTGATVSSYAIHQKQLNHEGKIEARDGKVFFTYTEEGKTDTDDEKLADNMIVGATTIEFLQKNWAAILKGDTVDARYASADRKETVGFKFFKSGRQAVNGQDAVVVTMKPSSIIIAAIVKPLLFFLSMDGQRLLELRGRVVPKQNVGGKWKDLDAEIVYTY